MQKVTQSIKNAFKHPEEESQSNSGYGRESNRDQDALKASEVEGNRGSQVQTSNDQSGFGRESVRGSDSAVPVNDTQSSAGYGAIGSGFTSQGDSRGDIDLTSSHTTGYVNDSVPSNAGLGQGQGFNSGSGTGQYGSAYGTDGSAYQYDQSTTNTSSSLPQGSYQNSGNVGNTRQAEYDGTNPSAVGQASARELNTTGGSHAYEQGSSADGMGDKSMGYKHSTADGVSDGYQGRPFSSGGMPGTVESGDPSMGGKGTRAEGQSGSN